MRIIIHRGYNQISGCITETQNGGDRILIDFGQNLPDGDGSVNDAFANEPAVKELTDGIDAIIYTHYHGDHIGLFEFVPDSVKQYIGKTAKEVLMYKYEHMTKIPDSEISGKIEVARDKISKMVEYSHHSRIDIGSIHVIPVFVSHSAYDSYMLVIEAGGKRVLHTGDFHGHGYLSKGLYKELPRLAKKSILTL